MNYRHLITIEPGKRGSKPCIRGLCITVYDVLNCLTSGISEDEILNGFPILPVRTSALTWPSRPIGSVSLLQLLQIREALARRESFATTRKAPFYRLS
jgi:hypothetical protein